MKTEQQYLDEAAQHEQHKEDSFERSDTDGFLTQWADGLAASLARTKAELTKNNKLAEFTGLYQGNRRVAAKIIDTKYGSSWLLTDEEAKVFNRKFISTGKGSRVQKQLGLREAKETAPAWASYAGQGTGLSGTAYIVVFRTGDKNGLDATLLEKN